MTISRQARLNIFQTIKKENLSWSGELTDLDFLSRIYDLEAMPSHDQRHQNAKWDIFTHTINWPGDWDDYWVFEDKRFNLMECSDEQLLRFLCEMIHPVVRTNAKERENLLNLFNQELNQEGYEIIVTKSSFGNLHYEPKGLLTEIIDSLNQLRDDKEYLNSENVQRQVVRMMTNIETDPELAIGTSKEFLETSLKTILAKLGVEYQSNSDLTKLAKQVFDEIRKDESTDNIKLQTIRKKLEGSLLNLVQSIAELRNSYGTGHGKESGNSIIDSKHAALAVNASVTLVFFLRQFYYQKFNASHND